MIQNLVNYSIFDFKLDYQYIKWITSIRLSLPYPANLER